MSVEIHTLRCSTHSKDLAYLVNDCPRKDNDEGDRSLRSRCQGTDVPRTYHIDLPVKAVVRGTTHEAGWKRLLTFANVFCALCNGIPHRDIRPLNAGLACNNLDIVRDCGLSILGDIVAPRNYVSGSLRFVCPYFVRGGLGFFPIRSVVPIAGGHCS